MILFPVDWFQFVIFTQPTERIWQQQKVPERAPANQRGFCHLTFSGG